jgi:two-component system, OmpR family, phosphate regulon response regulator OmpR
MPGEANPLQILLVDDDLRLRALLETFLKREGFDVLMAGNARQMEKRLSEHHVDLMVLDLMLPDRGGLEICRDLRAAGNRLPVLMLTAKGDDVDRVLGLELGADDYLPKPCNPRELVARIRAIMRRQQAIPPGAPVANGEIIRFGRCELNTAQRTLLKAGTPVELTTGEFAVLLALATRPGETLSRERLTSLARGRLPSGSERAIDIAISRLRRLVEDDPARPRHLQTVWGSGYVFVADPP